MSIGVLTAFEHQLIAVGSGPGSLTDAEAIQLLSLNNKRRGFCSVESRGVRLAQHAGLVRLSDRVLEVLPKLGEELDPGRGRGTLVRLLASAYGLRVTNTGPSGQGLARRPLLEIFLDAFLNELSLLVRSGLVRRYRCEEEDLGLIRGRMDMTRQATTLAMRVDVLACRFDELTPDNPSNQFLKFALRATKPWIRSVSLARRWKDVLGAFDEVSDVRLAGTATSFIVDRRVANYSPALRWAGWILDLLSPNFRAGQGDAPAMLFDMNMLFEAAVAKVLARKAARCGIRVLAQDNSKSLVGVVGEEGAEEFNLRPDLVLQNDDGVVAIGDTKWVQVFLGRGGRAAPSEAHVYQLHAYASAYRCSELALLYPYHSGLSGVAPTAFRLPSHGGGTPILHVHLIDVGQEGLPIVGSGHKSLFDSILRPLAV